MKNLKIKYVNKYNKIVEIYEIKLHYMIKIHDEYYNDVELYIVDANGNRMREILEDGYPGKYNELINKIK